MNKSIFYSIFSLFHHDVSNQSNLLDFDTKHLYNLTNETVKNEFINIVETIFNIVKSNIKNYKDSEVSLTLTGGMDSRIILACLLKAGIKPNCLTFGNPNSWDVICAKNIAESNGLVFHNACKKPPSKEWYYKWVVETIKRGKGDCHLHRAHRTAAIAEHTEVYKPKVLFTGHMGGEGLRGLTYNNYFSSPFFELVNERQETTLKSAKQVLRNYFLNEENNDYENLFGEIQNLSWMNHDRETNKFFFLYDLVAKIHHAQDIRLYQSYIPKVVPVYLQQEYLEALFGSPYNFLSKGHNVLNRLRNPEFYCKAIKAIYPPLLDLPFANGFTPQEYLKGLWYYVPVKIFRDHRKEKKYAPTYSYGNWYVDFVKEHSQNITPEIWEIFNKERYMEALENNIHHSDEGYWHRFSNPIYFDLVNKYKEGKL